MENICVSIIIPILNEEKYISKCIESVLTQDYPKKNLELLLIDGESEDNTIKIVNEYINKYSFIRLLSNSRKTVQYALNIGISNAVGKYIVRMDAHAEYADNYVSKCIEYLEKTDAVNVGGPMIASWKNNAQRVVAAAYHSDFALGGGKNHKEGYEGYADTVFLGAFKRDYIVSMGMYDERLPRSEDDDLNFRISENGDKIFITPEIKSKYYPRSSYKQLFKQYYEYGLWKVAVIKKHKRPARISHLVPMMFVAFLLLSMFLPKILSLPIICAYILLDAYYSFKSPYLDNFIDKIKLIYVHFIIHISYGLGFWHGIFKFISTKW